MCVLKLYKNKNKKAHTKHTQKHTKAHTKNKQTKQTDKIKEKKQSDGVMKFTLINTIKSYLSI